MGAWKAVSIPRVEVGHIRALLQEQDAVWESVAHVTATASLSRGIQETGTVASPIATLIDLIVWPGVADYSLPLDDFPGPDVLGRSGKKVYETQVRNWQMLARGRQMRLGIKFDEALRQFATSGGVNHRLARLLVRSRRDFGRTLRALIAAGVQPQDMSATDPLCETALSAWDALERNVPGLTATRDDLWIDFHEFESQATPKARNLRDRIEQALERVYGVRRGKRVIVHHGFYFFTPPQWALFQLLRGIPNVDQIFVIHDDSENPAFETWRRFFVEKWEMPAPSPAGSQTTNAKGGTHPAGTAFLKSLRGETVEVNGLAERLSILECRSPAELVRQWRLEDAASNEDSPHWFAADAGSVERYMRRLSRKGEKPTDLAQLPLGTFLLAVHDCIKPLPEGGAKMVLSEEALVDIVSSGYLVMKDGDLPSESDTIALRRALPFFRSCASGEEWRTRALHLHRLIIAEVEPLGGRDPTAADLKRISVAAANPLRLAPWADISLHEAVRIVELISAATRLIERISARERIVLKDHLQFLKESLEVGLRQLRDDDRQAIVAKVQGFSVGLDDEIAVEGVVDIVAMVLGSSPDFDNVDDPTATNTFVKDLRGLDVLGLHPTDGDLHLANLASGLFPGKSSVIGWPFRIDDMFRGRVSMEQVITVEILKLRAESASLSDLYLLWLALDGVQYDSKVTLSWVSELDGERRSLSPLVSLITSPTSFKPAISLRAGGITIANVDLPDMSQYESGLPVPAHTPEALANLAEAVARIDPRAAASGKACARRLALQWLVGESHGFQAEHHQAMLYGNMVGALMRGHGYSRERAKQVADDFWRHLTAGQRSSSLSQSRVKYRGAPEPWILTLGGNQDLSYDSPIDFAYRAAMAMERPTIETVAPAESKFLPPGINDSGTCRQCPVRRDCAVWEEERR